jgi:hypothetical protein
LRTARGSFATGSLVAMVFYKSDVLISEIIECENIEELQSSPRRYIYAVHLPLFLTVSATRANTRSGIKKED